jgi:hypothetical protein
MDKPHPQQSQRLCRRKHGFCRKLRQPRLSRGPRIQREVRPRGVVCFAKTGFDEILGGADVSAGWVALAPAMATSLSLPSQDRSRIRREVHRRRHRADGKGQDRHQGRQRLLSNTGPGRS